MRKQMKWLVAIALLSAASEVAMAQTAIYRVDASATGGENGLNWGDAFTSIHDALAGALHGDEIWVAQGTYPTTAGSDRTATFNIPEGVQLRGGYGGVAEIGSGQQDDRDFVAFETILTGEIGDPGDTTDNALHVVTINSDANQTPGDGPAIINGVTITGGYALDPTNFMYPVPYGGGVLSHKRTALVNCTIRDNYAGLYGGGVAFNGEFIHVHNCRFIDNSVGDEPDSVPDSTPGETDNGWGGGMWVQWTAAEQATYQIVNCLFDGNEAGGQGGGLAVHGKAGGDVVNCTFVNNVKASPAS